MKKTWRKTWGKNGKKMKFLLHFLTNTPIIIDTHIIGRAPIHNLSNAINWLQASILYIQTDVL